MVTEIGDGHRFAVHTGFSDSDLDWKAMRIPAEDKWGLIALHVLVTDGEIFEEPIEHVAAVNVAVGVWRAIMEKVFFATLSVLVHLFVKIHLMPLFNHLRFFDGEVSPHLKAGVRHKQCVFELTHGFSPFKK